jgi:hypothetical protein
MGGAARSWWFLRDSARLNRLGPLRSALGTTVVFDPCFEVARVTDAMRSGDTQKDLRVSTIDDKRYHYQDYRMDFSVLRLITTDGAVLRFQCVVASHAFISNIG